MVAASHSLPPACAFCSSRCSSPLHPPPRCRPQEEDHHCMAGDGWRVPAAAAWLCALAHRGPPAPAPAWGPAATAAAVVDACPPLGGPPLLWQPLSLLLRGWA
eukprot:scaffold152500_cov17-Tisochrysis_lutea.AAC.2